MQTANYLNTIYQRKIMIHVDQSYEASLDHEGFRIEDPVRKWAFYVFSWWTGELFLQGWSQVSKYSPSETPGHFRLIFRFTFGDETRWQVVQNWWKRRPAGFQQAPASSNSRFSVGIFTFCKTVNLWSIVRVWNTTPTFWAFSNFLKVAESIFCKKL